MRAMGEVGGASDSPVESRTSLGQQSTLPHHAAPAPDAVIARGERVGRYVVVTALGAGSMGVVYVAYDPELDRRIALKILPVRNPLEQGRWQAEAQAMARLRHENVVAVHDVGVHQGSTFIAMELVEGRTLQQWLRETPRSATEILRVFMQAGRGLAAAHRVGIVHGDFKPSNALVGGDGSVKVCDFGLARTGEGVHQLKSADGEGAATAWLVGTPDYMAPEQARAGMAGVASDQFAFCASLYEGLWGSSPFPPRADASLDSYIADRRALEPPARPLVPRLLRGIVMRGMAPAPDARHASMAALLHEGEHVEVAARRQRRLRVAALVLAALALAAVAGMKWQRVAARHASQAREVAAQRRLAVMEQGYAELVAHKRHADAERQFGEFTRLEENRGTDALAQAWLDHAASMHAQGQLDRELDAWTMAFTQAPGQKRQVEALLGLSASFERRWDWDGLDAAVRLIDRQPPTDATQAERVESLRVAALLARRELVGAATTLAAGARTPRAHDPSATARTLAALARGTRTDLEALDVAPADLPGGKALFVLSPDGEQVIAVRAARGLEPMWSASLTAALGPASRIWALSPGQGRWFLLAQHRSPRNGGVAAVYQVQDGRLVLVYSWQENYIAGALSADLAGTGTAQMFVGTGAYSRRLLQLVEGPHGFSVSEPVQDMLTSRSDVVAMSSVGQSLLLGVGPWHAYDVRVVQAGAQGLHAVARLRLGLVTGLAPIVTAAGPRIAAAKGDQFPSQLVFPDGDHLGPAAGIYFLDWTGSSLAVASSLVAPRPEAGARQLTLGPLGVADLDGDGRSDLFTTLLSPGKAQHAFFAVQQADGTFAPLLVGGMTALHAAQLDQDPADELLVELADDSHLWILGLGDTPLPAIERGSDVRAKQREPAPSGADAVLTRMWERGNDLAAMGLLARAAAVYDVIAEWGGPAGEAARQHAGILWEAHGDFGLAATRLASVAHASARLHAAELSARLHDFDAAYALAADAAGLADASAEERRLALQLQAEMAARRAAPALTLDFHKPLDASWSIVSPEALRSDLREGVLRIDAFNDGDRIAELPVEAAGDWLSISVDLDVLHTDWGAGVEVVSQDDSSPTLRLGIAIGAYGGGGLLERRAGCIVPGRPAPSLTSITPIDSASLVEGRRITVSYVPSLGQAWCTVASRDGTVVHSELVPVKLDTWFTASRLVIRQGGEAELTGQLWASANLHEIATRGLRVHASPDDPVQLGHRQLVEGNPGAALAAYDATPRPSDASWVIGRVSALHALGRQDQALAALAAARRSGVRVDEAMWHLVRMHDRAFAPLVQALLGRSYVHQFLTHWEPVLQMELADPRVQELITGTLSSAAASFPASKPGERLEAAFFLGFRGEAWWYLGHVGSARADLERALELGQLQDVAAQSDLAVLIYRIEIGRSHVILAALLIDAGDEAKALTHARAALGIAGDEVRDWMMTIPELARRRGARDWDEVLGP